MTMFLRDARFGVRLLRRKPGFTAVAVITLALGISATTAIFSVVYGTFFAPLPYRQADRLVMVWEHFRDERVPVSAANYVEWRRRATAFSDLNAWGGRSVNLATSDRPENLLAGSATPGFLPMMGYGHPLALGRTFIEEEGIVGRDQGRRSSRTASGRTVSPATPASSGARCAWTARPTPSSAFSAKDRPTISRTSCGCRWPSRPSNSRARATGST